MAHSLYLKAVHLIAVARKAFEVVGARPEDELHDLYPGTGAVTRAWLSWRGLFLLPAPVEPEETR